MKTLFLIALMALNLTCYAGEPKCKAITKAGTQCKKSALKGIEFCTIHNPNAKRCGQMTKSGKPCQKLGTCKNH